MAVAQLAADYPVEYWRSGIEWAAIHRRAADLVGADAASYGTEGFSPHAQAVYDRLSA